MEENKERVINSSVDTSSSLSQMDESIENSSFFTKKHLWFIFGIVVVLFFIVLSVLVYLFVFDVEDEEAQNKDNNMVVSESSDVHVSPTPFPFQEMTVPGLRSREYTSSIDELEEYSSSNGYASYLTSYVSDGSSVNAFLTIPKGEAPPGGWPAIVFVHGYIPPARYSTTDSYSAYVDYFAKNGFVVLKTDLRGHASSEGEAGGGYFSDGYIVDVLNARAALQDFDDVNPERIGLWGHSMAGNVVLRSMVARPEIPAIVIWAGAVYTYEDMQEYGIQDNSYQRPPEDSDRRRKRNELFETYGEFDPESEFWKQVAPTNYLADITGAVGIQHAVNDDVVSIEYSRNLVGLLESVEVEYEFDELSSGGHNISGGAFSSAMSNTVEFFKKHL